MKVQIHAVASVFVRTTPTAVQNTQMNKHLPKEKPNKTLLRKTLNTHAEESLFMLESVLIMKDVKIQTHATV